MKLLKLLLKRSENSKYSFRTSFCIKESIEINQKFINVNSLLENLIKDFILQIYDIILNFFHTIHI